MGIPRGTPLTADNLNRYFLAKETDRPQIIENEVLFDTDSGYSVFIGGRPGTEILDPPYIDHTTSAHFWNQQGQYARITAGTNSAGIWVSASSDTTIIGGGTSITAINLRGRVNIWSTDYSIQQSSNQLHFTSQNGFVFKSAGSNLPDIRVLDSGNSNYIRMYKSGAGYIHTDTGNIVLRPANNDILTIATSGVTLNSGNFYVSSGSVGIGTSSPAGKLHVAGEIISTTRGSRVGQGSTPAGYIAASDFAIFGSHTSTGTIFEVFNGSGTSVIKVLGSTNVGIGTTSPAYKLDVAGDVRFTGTLQGGTVPWARLSGVPFASTSAPGIVQLNNTTSSTSTTVAATASAVKAVNDALNTHKTSGDHDGRYYTKAQTDARIIEIGPSITVMTGEVGHDQLIPIPPGYTEDQCTFFISWRSGRTNARNDLTYLECWIKDKRRAHVRLRIGSSYSSGTANYLVIAVK